MLLIDFILNKDFYNFLFLTNPNLNQIQIQTIWIWTNPNLNKKMKTTILSSNIIGFDNFITSELYGWNLTNLSLLLVTTK